MLKTESKVKTIISIAIWILFTAATHAQSNRIEFEAAFAYPEGVAYNSKTDEFFVSSVTTGKIVKVSANGKYEVLFEDKGLKSTFGMKVDEKANKLWVCVSDPNYSKYKDSTTYKKMARLISIDLTTKKKVNDIDLAQLIPGKHFANDVVFDNKGNLYVTDSFSPAIYKIDAASKASVLVKNDLFSSKQVGLNGLVFHSEGYLLVAHNTKGALYKIDLKDVSKTSRSEAQAPVVSKVKINTFFPGADGMIIDRNNNVILVQNKGVNKVFQLTSDDHWASAKVVAETQLEDRFQNPTTVAIRQNKVYVLNSKMNELADSTLNPSKTFSIQEANFRLVPNKEQLKQTKTN